MADKDVMGTFDYDQFGGAGLFLKFKADRPVVVRILTTDPIISQMEFTDKKTGETNLNTRFSYIVYNFTDIKAQILGASAAMSRKFGELHTDKDFGANIRNMDIKISPTGEGLERRYDIQVLRHSGNQTKLVAEQIHEAQAIDLDDLVNDSRGRMSEWDQAKKNNNNFNDESGYEKFKSVAGNLKTKVESKTSGYDDEPLPEEPPNGLIIENVSYEEISLDDIPF